ncbi:MAG: hypothetical protein E7557_08370 [Ruminococcaceae bacterium]|nr:hypothetical protein [Oscillospiraceae bacterium]
MDYEQALCFKLMLEEGFSDSFFIWYDEALNECKFDDLLLDLNFNISNKNKTIEILNEYILDAKEINREKLFDLIWNEFHNLWVAGKITQEKLIKTFYSVYLKLDNNYDIWFSVDILDEYYGLMTDGIINREKFDEMFHDFIENKADISKYDIWNYEKKSLKNRIINTLKRKT